MQEGLSRKITNVAVRVGWLIDGYGRPALKDRLITIDDGVIRKIAVLRPRDPAAPGTINMSDYTILPALVDSHVHLFMSGTVDLSYRKQQLEAGFDWIKGTIERHLRQHLASGVIAVRDGGDRQAHALRYKATIQLIGSKLPYINAAGSAWHRAGRYGRLIARSPAGGQSLASAIAADELQVDHVKIVNSGLNSLVKFGHATTPQFSADELRGAVDAAGKKGLKVMVHANGSLPVKIAVDSGCHSIEHGFFMGRENLLKMADREIYWIPTAGTMAAFAAHLKKSGQDDSVAQRNLEHQLEQIRLAKRFGVRIAAGTDAGSLGVHHGSSLVEELSLLQQGGLTIEEAICCAGENGAGLIGRRDIGRLKAGLPATFIAVKGCPLDSIAGLAAVEAMYCNGESVPALKAED